MGHMGSTVPGLAAPILILTASQSLARHWAARFVAFFSDEQRPPVVHDCLLTLSAAPASPEAHPLGLPGTMGESIISIPIFASLLQEGRPSEGPGKAPSIEAFSKTPDSALP